MSNRQGMQLWAFLFVRISSNFVNLFKKSYLGMFWKMIDVGVGEWAGEPSISPMQLCDPFMLHFKTEIIIIATTKLYTFSLPFIRCFKIWSLFRFRSQAGN